MTDKDKRRIIEYIEEIENVELDGRNVKITEINCDMNYGVGEPVVFVGLKVLGSKKKGK